MNTYPLESITLEQAKTLQFKLIDLITSEFRGKEILSLGDLGVTSGINKPTATLKAEKVLAKFFEAEEVVLVRGAGTAAIRWGLLSMIRPGQNLLVHDAPIYPTTKVTIDSMGLNLIKADFNITDNILEALKVNKVNGVLIQYTRQKIDDSYDITKVIETIKGFDKSLPILTDDNYAVMKVRNIGVQCGAELSAFSLFKLLGPEGIGCVVGRKEYIDKIISWNYSGGGQVQGHEAMELLRGLAYAPVALAIQAEVSEEIVRRLNKGEIEGVKNAFIANAQSKVVLVEFEKDIAKDVLREAELLGAAPNPVGAESKYEFVPMFYRVSGTFRAADKALENRMIRINPMRAGADGVLRILNEALDRV
ncbi:aminotransferase class V-fold PLP-dependent enzyme [Clostridium sp. YIM B02515]|uniref:Aminotransferase class V-fold PLP-dependent enzyme n=1 Tax=Clostridium rhizosphaerae TaxID=2803861 RepID=A0ABS1T4W7_9CLOT|nr:aminotransferase class V-fold PLP-dependent enzyme [Clostridium rhizosphaerae]MBL4934301.1 aminotransferase class V-fold PLP-dependent enzyme [Clostridium rhizosphaerae]